MSEGKAESPLSEASLPAGWTKEFSKTHQKHYYFCHTNGKTSWTAPSTEKSERNDVSSSSSPVPQKTAVIVPFRDLHKSQKRKEHLETFIPAE